MKWPVRNVAAGAAAAAAAAGGGVAPYSNVYIFR
jgi:hypothetical protein